MKYSPKLAAISWLQNTHFIFVCGDGNYFVNRKRR